MPVRLNAKGAYDMAKKRRKAASKSTRKLAKKPVKNRKKLLNKTSKPARAPFKAGKANPETIFSVLVLLAILFFLVGSYQQNKQADTAMTPPAAGAMEKK